MLDVDRLLDELDLVDLAHQAGARLRQSGQQWRGPCPLHHGDNPTGFAIMPGRDDPNRMHYWCHRCGAGDAISFIRCWRSLEFIDAAKWAADLLRIPLADLGLTPQASQEHAERGARRDVLDLAARFYQRRFRHEPVAIAYAIGRAFTARTLTRFGYSNGQGLRAWLEMHQADLKLAHKIGLLRGDGRDFTSNQDGDKASPAGWLVYIHWNGGRVDYLSARALDPIDPKDKSRNMPGKKQVYRAEARGDLNIALVEGQADAETLRQLGISAWALCGAALTDADIRALSRRRAVYLALDDDTHREGDEDETAERAATTAKHQRQLADRLGPLTFIAPELSAGIKDVNQWLQKNPELTRKGVAAWLAGSEVWLDRRVDTAVRSGPTEQAEQISDIAHLLARLPHSIQAKWYKRVGKLLGMTQSELKSANGQAPSGDYMAAEISEGCLTLYGVPLINAAPLITHQQTVNDGTNPPAVRYTIAGRLANGQPLRELTVLASDFEGLGWMSEWGARVIKLCSNGNRWQIARAIQEISIHGSAELIEENVYAHTGWATVSGQRSFLSSAGRLTATGLDTDTKIDLGESNMRHALPAPPQGEALRHAVRASMDFLTVGPRRVTAILWAAMYAAPLTALRSLDTMIWVYGSSGSGKSTVSHLALAHFGASFIAGRKYVPQIGWNATPFAIETAMFVCKDAPLVIDDYAPQFMSIGDRDKLRKTANEVIRSLGNRLARARGSYRNGDATTKALHNPRGLVVSTAENPIEGQSLVNRMLYVPVEKGELLRKAGNPILDLAQDHAGSGLYAGAMSAFICWLIVNWDSASREFSAAVDNTSRQARALLPSGFDRLPDYAAILDASQQLALRAFTDLGLINKDLAEGEGAANHDAILDVVTKQAGRVAEQSPAQMFLRAIESLLDRGKVYLAPRKANTDFQPPEHIDKVGWYDPHDKGAIWLDTQVALSWAQSYWRDGQITFDTTRDALKRLMLQAEVLRAIDGASDNAEVSKYMGASGTKRALEIDLEKTMAQWQIDLRYPRTLHDIDDPDGSEPAWSPQLV